MMMQQQQGAYPPPLPPNSVPAQSQQQPAVIVQYVQMPSFGVQPVTLTCPHCQARSPGSSEEYSALSASRSVPASPAASTRSTQLPTSVLNARRSSEGTRVACRVV